MSGDRTRRQIQNQKYQISRYMGTIGFILCAIDQGHQEQQKEMFIEGKSKRLCELGGIQHDVST